MLSQVICWLFQKKKKIQVICWLFQNKKKKSSNLLEYSQNLHLDIGLKFDLDLFD